LKDPKVFDKLLAPRNKLKLMSICIGPFKTSPINYTVKI
jgi:hypothetical protein